jgi:tetratricopeptide (TPR) repeat protein
MIRVKLFLSIILLALAYFARAQQDDVNACLRQASILENSKKYQEALGYCTKAIILNPLFDESYFRRGYYKFLLGDNAGAIRDFDVAIKLNPDNVDAHLYKASCLQKTGSNVGALNEYNQARKLDAFLTISHVAKGILGSVVGQ